MHWLAQNINHFTAPAGEICGLFAMILGIILYRKRKSGETAPVLTGSQMILSILVIAVTAILLGIALGHNFS